MINSTKNMFDKVSLIKDIEEREDIICTYKETGLLDRDNTIRDVTFKTYKMHNAKLNPSNHFLDKQKKKTVMYSSTFKAMHTLLSMEAVTRIKYSPYSNFLRTFLSQFFLKLLHSPKKRTSVLVASFASNFNAISSIVQMRSATCASR